MSQQKRFEHNKHQVEVTADIDGHLIFMDGQLAERCKGSMGKACSKAKKIINARAIRGWSPRNVPPREPDWWREQG
jgi:hypothetical protein